MKTSIPHHIIRIALVALLLSTLNLQFTTAHAQGTAFTYQGRLNSGTNAANGTYDLRFKLYSDALGTTQVGSSLVTNGLPISNGLFTVVLDFGANFPGANRWLEIAVKTNLAGIYTVLTPLQSITPTPYAITAGNVTGVVASGSLSGTYSGAVTLNNTGNSFNGAFTGNGANVTNVNAATLGGLNSSNFWRTTGNTGTSPGANFLGTTDNQPLELKVNGVRALRLEPTLNDFNHSDLVNVVNGSPVNFVAPGVYGATIGGGAGNYFGNHFTNRVTADFGTVGGGVGNIASDNNATVGGGSVNTASGYTATVGGGSGNTASGSDATVGGGQQNTASGFQATVGGGELNTADGFAATVGGGDGNIASNSYATVGGGHGNTASGSDATVGGGQQNIASSVYATLGGGFQNTASGFLATVGGGYVNTATNDYATVPGGRDNTAGGQYSLAAGRRAKSLHDGSFVWADSVNADFATTTNNQFLIRASGGVGINTNNPQSALHVSGTITATTFAGNGTELTNVNAATLGGLNSSNFWQLGGNAGVNPTNGAFLGTTDNLPLELKVNGVRALRLEPTLNDFNHSDLVNVVNGSPVNFAAPGVYGATISGGGGDNYFGNHAANSVTADFGTVGGGFGNTASSYATVSGGMLNTASNIFATIGGGNRNIASGYLATIGGGDRNIASDLLVTMGGGAQNTASGIYATVDGGYQNTASSSYTTLGGGQQNTASGSHATVGGGYLNTANNDYATVPGGRDNTAGGQYSLAAGHRAKSLHDGAFVWADSTDIDFVTTGMNQFLIRASGGVGINTNNPQSALHVNGTITATTFAGNGAGNSFTGNGTGLTNVNATTLGGLNSSNFWRTTGNTGTSPGANFLGTTDNQPLELKVNGVRALRLEPTLNDFNHSDLVNVVNGSPVNFVAPGVYGATIGGGAGNYFGNHFTNRVTADFGTVGGGVGNIASDNNATVGGGSVNTASGYTATVGGGSGNTASSSFATVGGGYVNTASGNNATVGGGYVNTASGDTATVGGGYGNTASDSYATVGGGYFNTVTNDYATVLGGRDNTAGGQFSLAAGRRAKSLHDGAFVWADSQNADFASTSSNQFLIRASGNVGIGTASPSRLLEIQKAGDAELGIKSTDTGAHLWTLQSSAVSGNVNLDASFQIIDRTLESSRLYIGTNGFVGIGTTSPTNKLQVNGGVSATVFVTTSDRNAKENFTAVSSRDILEKVVALPVTQWSFKEIPGAMHIGPMAQDFYASFKVGSGSTGIATVDADGVALAAIQGLNQKVEEKESRIRELEKTVGELKKLVGKLANNKNGGTQ